MEEKATGNLLDLFMKFIKHTNLSEPGVFFQAPLSEYHLLTSFPPGVRKLGPLLDLCLEETREHKKHNHTEVAFGERAPFSKLYMLSSAILMVSVYVSIFERKYLSFHTTSESQG